MTRECRNCGSPVSDRYARVLAGNDGVVNRCPDCSSAGQTMSGGVAGLATNFGERKEADDE